MRTMKLQLLFTTHTNIKVVISAYRGLYTRHEIRTQPLLYLGGAALNGRSQHAGNARSILRGIQCHARRRTSSPTSLLNSHHESKHDSTSNQRERKKKSAKQNNTPWSVQKTKEKGHLLCAFIQKKVIPIQAASTLEGSLSTATSPGVHPLLLRIPQFIAADFAAPLKTEAINLLRSVETAPRLQR